MTTLKTKHAAVRAADAPLLLPSLTPLGQLRLVHTPEALPLATALAERIGRAFAVGAGHGLLQLGAAEVATALPPLWAYWRDFAVRYVTALTATPEGGAIAVPAPDAQTLETLALDVPPMRGAEYLTAAVLAALWAQIEAAVQHALAAAGTSLQDFLKARHPAWNLVGRVHFHLAENRQDALTPFAFLATYTTQLSAHGKAQHVPLSQALTAFSGARSKAQLLSLLLPVQRAAEQCPWLAEMVAAGEIYYPLSWRVDEAVVFLHALPALEAAGIVVRMPARWHLGRPSRPQVKATLGTKPPSVLGMNALLDFDMAVTLEGEPLNAKEVRALLASADELQWLRGRWVALDQSQLARVLARFEAIKQAAEDGLAFGEAMRLLAGAHLKADDAPDPEWSEVAAGPWLSDLLHGLLTPEGLAAVDPGTALNATLRPYQQAGLRWLYLLTRLGLGACLADDMGLGKTIQVLALLLVLQRESGARSRPTLLVAPASLLDNWVQEARRFAPSLKVFVAHPAFQTREALRTLDADQLAGFDLVITSYATLPRLPALVEARWQLAVIDEAQAIKTPGTRQTRTVKQLNADSRIALTGTPVENRLSDLWSIFDFTVPGLLGSQRAFADYSKRLTHYGALRGLVAPYILRRLKTDRRIITDLPDKTEVVAWCGLSTAQAVLYQRAVEELKQVLADSADGIARRGRVLAFLMRFKQVCNHPSHWLGDGVWRPADSGKFARLAELVEVIAARQEKVLVFTQFQETTAPLAAFLGGLFGREGLVLHGGTPVAKRRELVRRFQDDEDVPFFVLSLKAGGAGLNLTAANHVIHFDRWWNPAVEQQATDRAYRIGQHRNVLVHKFVCRGSIEERIDALIASKQQLAQDVLEGGAEINLTGLSDSALLDLVKLDIHTIEE